jgi:hypothetical protein
MMVTRLQKLVGCVTLTLTLAVGPVSAHHSFAMYDSEKVVTVEGTVTEFKWANPHVLLRVMAAGAGQLWTMELTAPGQLARNGWTHSTLKSGDTVKVKLHPFRDGRPGGSFMSITVNGEEISR